MRPHTSSILLYLLLPVFYGVTLTANAAPDFTCFQEAGPYTPQLDIGSDMAVVYGVNNTFADRVAQWREKGYAIGMMTGISWGGYDDYYQTPEGFKKEEVQTSRTGRLYMHGDSTTVGYIVPSDAYIEYIKKVVEPAVDLGARAIFMEEPEYWAETGWSRSVQAGMATVLRRTLAGTGFQRGCPISGQ